jgi:hypothetical protein
VRWLLALALLAACDDGRPGPLHDCGGDLRGVWHDADGHRFDVIGADAGWEWYPMYDDRPTALPERVTVAPMMIEMPRLPGDLTGTLTRRYERGAVSCPQKTVATLTACHGEHAELRTQDPTPPSFPDCTPAAPVERVYLLSRE